MGRHLSWVGVALTLVYFLGGWHLFGLSWDEIRQLPPNEIGDFLAGVFGPVAIFWLVLGFFQQGEELRHSVEALRLQAEELKSSVEQQKAMVSVAEKQFSLEVDTLQRQNAIMVSQALPFFLIEGAGNLSTGMPGITQYNFSRRNRGASAACVEMELDESYAELAGHSTGFCEADQVDQVSIRTNDSGRFSSEGVVLTIRSCNVRGSCRTQKFRVGNFETRILSSEPPAE